MAVPRRARRVHLRGRRETQSGGRPGQVTCWVTQMKTPSFPLFLCSHSSGPKADSSPKGSRGLGGLKSEFLKPSAARGVRTQDQPAGGKGRMWLLRGWCACGWEVAVSSVGLQGSRGLVSVCVCVCGRVPGSQRCVYACEGLGVSGSWGWKSLEPDFLLRLPC